MTRTIDLRKQARAPQDRPDASPLLEGTPEMTATAVPAQAPQELFANKIAWTTVPLHNRSRSATVTVAVLAASAALVWYFQGNFLFTLFLGMSAVAFAIMPRPQRLKTRVILAEEGVTINDAWYHYPQLHSFWITYVPGAIRELSLETAQWHVPYIKVPLGDQNPNHVRSFLMQYLPEKEHRISIIDALVRLVGF